MNSVIPKVEVETWNRLTIGNTYKIEKASFDPDTPLGGGVRLYFTEEAPGEVLLGTKYTDVFKAYETELMYEEMANSYKNMAKKADYSFTLKLVALKEFPNGTFSSIMPLYEMELIPPNNDDLVAFLRDFNSKSCELFYCFTSMEKHKKYKVVASRWEPHLWGKKAILLTVEDKSDLRITSHQVFIGDASKYPAYEELINISNAKKQWYATLLGSDFNVPNFYFND